MEKCELCDKTFGHKKSLNRHLFKIHNKYDGVLFNCELCGVRFKRKSNYSLHITACHNTEYVCGSCNRSFLSKDLIKKHFKNDCNEIEERKNKSNLKCPYGCGFIGSTKENMRHLEQDHGYKNDTAKIIFNSYDEFVDWKKEEEEKTKSFFFLRSKIVKNNTCYEYYRCNRSGCYEEKPSELRIRNVKQDGLFKTGILCPASVSVKASESSVEVSYAKHHLGHDLSSAHLHLCAKNSAEPADFSKERFSGNNIIKSIKHSTSTNIAIEDMDKIELTNVNNEQVIEISQVWVTMMEQDSDGNTVITLHGDATSG